MAVVRDEPIQFPELYCDVFVVGDAYDQSMFARLFVKAKCKKAFSIDESDLVVFSGGDDVNPALYGTAAHPNTRFDSKRDEEDLRVYEECVKKGIPMFGVCRGMQFGHVMNGGKLFQHVDNHYGDHFIFDVRGKKPVKKVSSVHHQLCMDNTEGGMEMLAFASRTKERWLAPNLCETETIKDIEALFYRDTCFLGVQGHPEYRGYDEYALWCFELIEKYIVCNPDLELAKDTNLRRMKRDILEQRSTKEMK